MHLEPTYRSGRVVLQQHYHHEAARIGRENACISIMSKCRSFRAPMLRSLFFLNSELLLQQAVSVKTIRSDYDIIPAIGASQHNMQSAINSKTFMLLHISAFKIISGKSSHCLSRTAASKS